MKIGRTSHTQSPARPREIVPNVARLLNGWLSLLTFLALVLGTSMAQAATVNFNDGGTHTINDATYQLVTINVSNGTSLIFEPGAVLGGPAAGFPPIGAGVVIIRDTSRVTINGGSFGSADFQSGVFGANDHSTLTINGGSFGGAGAQSGFISVNNASTVTINGGTFGSTGQISGGLQANDSSRVTISGGTFGNVGTQSGTVIVGGTALVTISGGFFNNADFSIMGTPSATVVFQAPSFDTAAFNPSTGGILGVTFCSQSAQQIPLVVAGGTSTFILQAVACLVQFNDGGTHTINDATYQNNTIEVSNGTTLIIQPGAVFGGPVLASGTISTYDTSTVTIYGGTFGATAYGSGAVNGYDTSTLTIHGGTFGGTGDSSGSVVGADASNVTINGGNFGGGGASSGRPTLQNTSTGTINGGTFGGTGASAGWNFVTDSARLTINGGSPVAVLAAGSATVTFRASSFDITSFDSTFGGVLGVTFCSQPAEQISAYIALGSAASYVLQTITCAPSPIDPIITWTNPSDIGYGVALTAKQLNATANVPGTFTYSPSAGTVLNAGNAQTLSVTFTPADAAQYNVVQATVAINVLKATLTITAKDRSNVYGSPVPTLTATYKGFVNGDTAASLDTLNLRTTATQTSDVGTYPITASGAADINYNITTIDATLTVTKRPLTIKAQNKSKVYGAALPVLTASYSGLASGDTPANLDTPVVLNTTATTTSDVGIYPITASGGSDLNYDITTADGTLTVTKKALNIRAQPVSVIYGGAVPALTPVYVGLVNGDTPENLDVPASINTTATSQSDAGSYPITVSGASDLNYNITFADAVLTVKKALLTVTGDKLSKVYGEPLPALTAAYSGFVNGDGPANLDTAVSLNTSASAASDVGTYPIVLTAATDANYTIKFVNGSLTVTRAPLTITADHKTKAQGTANPTLTASYAGFVNGDTVASLDTPAVLSTTAKMTSFIGPYPITVKAAKDANYTIAFVNGTLDVLGVTHITTPTPGFTISSPGYYQLDVNLPVVQLGAAGLGIQANDVDLNLNGHTISGPISNAADAQVVPNNSSSGISINGANVHVYNGTVQGFGRGIVSAGVNSHDNHFDGLTLRINRQGILVFENSVNNQITGNTVSGNFEIGMVIHTSGQNTLNSNVINNNGGIVGGAGIFLVSSDSNLIADNIISDNPQNGGMRVFDSHSNTIRGNTVSGHSSSEGIRIDAGSSGNTLTSNAATANAVDLADYNLPDSCVNTWTGNTFGTDSEGDGAGVGCIR